jgi:hypothetical protein
MCSSGRREINVFDPALSSMAQKALIDPGKGFGSAVPMPSQSSFTF